MGEHRLWRSRGRHGHRACSRGLPSTRFGNPEHPVRPEPRLPRARRRGSRRPWIPATGGRLRASPEHNPELPCRQSARDPEDAEGHRPDQQAQKVSRQRVTAAHRRNPANDLNTDCGGLWAFSVLPGNGKVIVRRFTGLPSRSWGDRPDRTSRDAPRGASASGLDPGRGRSRDPDRSRPSEPHRRCGTGMAVSGRGEGILPGSTSPPTLPVLFPSSHPRG